MTDDHPSTPWPFVACLAVMVVSAATLILLIPKSTGLDGSDVPTWLMVTLAVLAVAAAAAARRLRPPRSR